MRTWGEHGNERFQVAQGKFDASLQVESVFFGRDFYAEADTARFGLAWGAMIASAITVIVLSWVAASMKAISQSSRSTPNPSFMQTRLRRSFK
jgi:hypothetical protein